jgi:hypothetical protein
MSSPPQHAFEPGLVLIMPLAFLSMGKNQNIDIRENHDCPPMMSISSRMLSRFTLGCTRLPL